jgi:hypothetical protein
MECTVTGAGQERHCRECAVTGARHERHCRECTVTGAGQERHCREYAVTGAGQERHSLSGSLILLMPLVTFNRNINSSLESEW